MAANIEIQIAASTQQAAAGIKSISEILKGLSTSLTDAKAKLAQLSTIAGGAVLVFNTVSSAARTVVSAVSEVVTAYSAQEQAERRLQTVLTATQGAVGMSATELFKLADSLSKVTGYSDQEIIAVEQMLVATRKIGRDIMPQATKAVLDMAAAIGDDAAGAAKDLAQALSDPAGEIESLKEKGIQLSTEQAENIKKVQEQNGLYEAQKILLAEVAGTYGDMAENIASINTGKLTRIKNVWEDIKEGLGEGLLNMIQPALDTLYERLTDIKDLVDKVNETREYREPIQEIYESGTEGKDLSKYTTEQLKQSIVANPYTVWLNEFGTQKTDADRYAEMGVRFSRQDYNDYVAITNEINSRNWRDQVKARTATWQSRKDNIAATNDITASMATLAPSVGSFVENPLVNPFADTWLSLGKDYAFQENSNARAEAQKSAVSDFISSNGALSSSYQVQSIQNRINEAQSMRWNTEYGSDEYNQITEIIGALEEQKKKYTEVGDAAEDAGDDAGKSTEELLKTLETELPNVLDQIVSIGDSFATVMQNMADSAADKLQDIRDKWDEYFEDLDRKQERQADSLNALLASGNMSYEDYIDAMNDMDKERSEAEEEAAKEEEEQRKKANELGRAAFVASQMNSVAQATINAALGITDIWSKYSSTPAIAGTLTAISTAATAAEIAAITSQQYTPMAAGGITEGPTRTLLGEGNPHELVMPLTEGNLARFGIGPNPQSGVINLTINIGTVYSKEELSEEIFNGIERAQRTGALPNWRYA